MKVVIDASVAVKWILPDPKREPHIEQALQLLRDLRDARIDVLQPPHWLIETAAVVTRLSPEAVEPGLDLLDAMELPVTADLATLKRGCQLAQKLNHHLFDTLYHAVAFEHGALLVTADDHYFRKAESLGQILPLKSWPGPLQEESGSSRK